MRVDFKTSFDSLTIEAKLLSSPIVHSVKYVFAWQ